MIMNFSSFICEKIDSDTNIIWFEKSNKYIIINDILKCLILDKIDSNKYPLNQFSSKINEIDPNNLKKIYGDIYDEIIGKYIYIIKSDKNISKKICDIKQLLYLAKSVINVNIFLRRLLSHLLKLDYDNRNKIMIVKEFTEYDIMINKSFRDLLCLEGLLISVMII